MKQEQVAMKNSNSENKKEALGIKNHDLYI